MAAPKGFRPPGGSRKGKPNKITADVRAMILAALDKAGGEDYLLAQSKTSPTAFMTLVGKVLPLQVGSDPENPLEVSYSDHEIAAKLAAILDAVKRRIGEA